MYINGAAHSMDASMDVNPSSDVPDPIVGRVYVDQDGWWWRYQGVSSTVVGTRDFYFAALDGVHHQWIAEETWKQNPMRELTPQELSPRDRPRPQIRDKTTPPR